MQCGSKYIYIIAGTSVAQLEQMCGPNCPIIFSCNVTAHALSSTILMTDMRDVRSHEYSGLTDGCKNRFAYSKNWSNREVRHRIRTCTLNRTSSTAPSSSDLSLTCVVAFVPILHNVRVSQDIEGFLIICDVRAVINSRCRCTDHVIRRDLLFLWFNQQGF